MTRGRPHIGESLLESYCSQLGTMLDRRNPGLALVLAKRHAETNAVRANREMLQAQASDRAKTKFLANMSHELRTPLNAIIGFSEVIQLNAQQPKDRYPEYAKYIHEAAVHLLEVINGILDLARIEAGKVEPGRGLRLGASSRGPRGHDDPSAGREEGGSR
jgi:two-component system, cell cycle sensor histidine kinase PleC